ncbi:MAG: DUF2384 domain-containing protein [Saprospiraceae bacterium]|nr:DUF2384 domain-containing protein [Saprospiraceae bacterium]
MAKAPKLYRVKDDPVWMVSEAAEGVEASLVDDLIEISGLSQRRVSEDYFNLSYKTVSRYIRDKKKLNPRDSETAIRLMALFHKGIDVMGTLDSFNAWLSKPAFGLGDRVPADLLITHAGIQLVMDELRRIEFGALA